MVKKGLLSLIKILALILIVLLLAYLFKNCQSLGYNIFSDKSMDVPGTENITKAVITISEGESLTKIGEDLERKHIIRDKWTFIISVRCMEDYKNITPGNYTVDSSMKPSEILTVIAPAKEEGQ